MPELKSVPKYQPRAVLLTSLTMSALLAGTYVAMPIKAYAAANVYDWNKQTSHDLLGGIYTSVASSADGSHLIAGVAHGGEGSGQSSPLLRSVNNGATWQNVAENADPGTRNFWTSVDISNDGHTVVAASDRTVDAVDFTGNEPGKIFISHDDGDSWQNISPDITEDWVSVAISGDESKIVAIANDDTNNVYVSTNGGTTWQTSAINGDVTNWSSVSISDDGDTILVGGESNLSAVALVEISTNGGTSWDSISPNTTDVSHAVRTSMSATGDKIVVTNHGWDNVGNIDNVYVSSNYGDTWTDITPDDAGYNEWTAVALSGDSSKLAVMDGNNHMYVSGDIGQNWTEEDPGQEGSDTNDWRSFDFSDDGTKAITAGSNNAYISSAAAPSVALTDPEGGKAITITTPGGTTITCHSAVKESTVSTKDVAYSYPMGLVDFCFSGADTSNSVNLIFVTSLTPGQVVARKFNPTSGQYSTITDAVITQTTYQGQPALQLAYTIVDNGPLDTDADLGEIADPVGLGLSDVGVPNTGLGKTNHSSLSGIATLLAGVVMATGLLVAPVRHSIRRLKQR